MIVSRFLLWAREAAPGHRAEAVSALARAYLHSDLSAEDRAQARVALTAMLDDHALPVRRSLAEALASSADAPRHIIVALASDVGEIACMVLNRSPVLTDGDLVDCAALGDEAQQCAIAARPWLSAAVSAALAEVATPPVLTALSRNPGAEIAPLSLARMVERHGSDGLLREALLVRPDLPVETAQAIAGAIAADLGRFVTGCGWLTCERSGRVTREARDRTAIALSAGADDDGAARLVDQIRRSGQLTPTLVLRAILSGSLPLAEAALSRLSGVASRRVSAILHDGRSRAFRALYRRARLPDVLLPAFEAAVSAYRDVGREEGAGGRHPSLSRRMVERALTACETLPEEEAGRLVALLRRFEAEAALDEARAVAGGLADQAALAYVLEHAPAALIQDGSRRAA